MFCKNCGAQLADGTKFCNSCGSPVGEAAPAANVPPVVQSSANQGKKKSPIGIIIIAIIAVIVFFAFSGGSGGYEDTVEDFFAGMFEADAKKLVSTFSEDYISEKLEDYGYENKSVLIKRLQDSLDEMADEYKSELGKKWTYEYEIMEADEDEDFAVLTISIDIKGKKKDDSDVWILMLMKDGKKWYVEDFYSA